LSMASVGILMSISAGRFKTGVPSPPKRQPERMPTFNNGFGDDI
jgi:hypothetical protein